MNSFEQDTLLRDELREIVENLNFILENTNKISPIERDILLQQLRGAYLSVLKLSTAPLVEPVPKVEPEPVVVAPVEKTAPKVEPEPVVVAPVEKTAPKVEPEPVVVAPVEKPAPKVEPEPVVVAPIVEPALEKTDLFLSQEENNDILDFLTNHQVDIVSEPVPAPGVNQPKQEVVIPVSEPQPVSAQPSLFPDEPVVAPKPAAKKSLNDLLMEQKGDNSIGTNFQHGKIQDLAKAISINDKFLFIRELFKGKGEEFGMAVQKLNRCQSMEAAFDEIEIMKKYYAWDTSSAAYLALCDVVRRKFI